VAFVKRTPPPPKPPPDPSSGAPGEAPPVVAAPADAELKQRRFPCKGCGARLEFKPGGDEIQCPYCGFVEKIPKTADAIDEFSFNDYLTQPKKGLGVAGRDGRCGQCAAIVRLTETTKATRCPFCGTPIVDELGDEGAPDVRPEAVAPFRIEGRDAQSRFHAWVKGLWFAPSMLKQEIRDSRVEGVYCPFWTFDAHTLSHYRGERGDAYYISVPRTVMVNGKPVTQMHQIRQVRWSFRSGEHEAFFDDVVVGAGVGAALGLHYDAARLVPYEPKYLAGFEAERPSVSVENGWTQARKAIDAALYTACCRKIGGDEQRNVSVKTAYRGITFKMVLLPVFVSSYLYKGAVYRFQVDGQTGRVSGRRPYSIAKILGAVFVGLLVVLAGLGVYALIQSH
jgi:DNA-directed RNA polymerase subunit RPC12/RpoP